MQVQRLQNNNYNTSFSAKLKWADHIGNKLVSPEMMQKYETVADKIGTDRDIINVELWEDLSPIYDRRFTSYMLNGKVIKQFSCMEDNEYIENLKKINHVKNIKKGCLNNLFMGLTILCDDKKVLQARITKYLTEALNKIPEAYNDLIQYDNKNFFEYLNSLIK